jgi:hypothetical protein
VKISKDFFISFNILSSCKLELIIISISVHIMNLVFTISIYLIFNKNVVHLFSSLSTFISKFKTSDIFLTKFNHTQYQFQNSFSLYKLSQILSKFSFFIQIQESSIFKILSLKIISIFHLFLLYLKALSKIFFIIISKNSLLVFTFIFLSILFIIFIFFSE